MKKIIYLFALLLSFYTCNTIEKDANTIVASENQMPKVEFSIVIHGGAGTILKKNMTPEKEAAYKAKLESNEEEAKRFEKLSDYKTNLTFNSLPYELALTEKDSVLRQKRDRWHTSLSKDVYIEEALNVLIDLKMTYGIKNKVAVIKD